MELLAIFYVAAGIFWLVRQSDGSWAGSQTALAYLGMNPTAATVPGTDNVLQLFYTDGDLGSIRTIWVEHGAWSAEQILGGVASTTITAVTVPGTDVLELFYTAPDGSVRTMWRNPTGPNHWSGEQNLGGHAYPGATVTAAPVPGTNNVLQLFYTDANGTIWTKWRNPTGPNYWSGEHILGSHASPIATITAAPVPGANNVLQLFYTDANGTIWTMWRNPTGPNHWTAAQFLSGGQAEPDESIAAGVLVTPTLI